jgi:hypothetical protein
MDTMEYHSPTVGEGFKMSRDDYWKSIGTKRTDYCRILQDDTDQWYAGCAVAGPNGLGPREIRDVCPPSSIKALLDAYESSLTWYRWQDDAIDYSKKSSIEIHGSPVFPTLLKPIKTRGVQFNRDPEKPMTDFLRWGECETLILDQEIRPNQIRAICFWVWWDSFEKGSRIMECSNGSMQDLVWIGVEGGGPGLPPAPIVVKQAAEVRPDHYLVLNPLPEPVMIPVNEVAEASYVFEIWDKDQRIMRLRAPNSARTNEWQHVTLTTTDTKNWWPTWELWINGNLVDKKIDGRSIPALTLKKNMIGKFRGCMQDFRVYKKSLDAKSIQTAMSFAKPLLHPSP